MISMEGFAKWIPMAIIARSSRCPIRAEKIRVRAETHHSLFCNGGVFRPLFLSLGMTSSAIKGSSST
jgi:hypothetical protein